MDLNFKIGDILYLSTANGTYCTLSKVEIVSVESRSYQVRYIDNIFYLWQGNRSPKMDMVGTAIESSLFVTYQAAEENLFSSMGGIHANIRTWRDFLKYMFECWRE